MAQHEDPLTPEAKWQAVCARDKGQDGTFVFAVLTTGVYCHPSCSSRRARRDNVSFFDAPADAERAGYRPCKRCKPDRALSSPHAEAIAHACAQIDSAEHEPSLEALARDAGLSAGYFQRLFKAQVGLSPKGYAVAARKQRFRQTLAQADSVTQAIYDAGYASASRAYADGAAGGMAPRCRLRGAEGEIIAYATAQTSLGVIVVAATQRGICLIEFIDPQQELIALAARFPQAQFRPAPAALADALAWAVEQIDHPQTVAMAQAPLSLDIRGTAFQEKVWKALSEIPCGATVSYSQLAHSLGMPKAARAVAHACALNRWAVVLPCHRVVRTSGELAGYKWGLERKRRLLEAERCAAEQRLAGNRSSQGIPLAWDLLYS
jgi:AraC family transcriptional regulator of adaptative response/methylated-DNA-[protein]-cysteine methyltransferase